MRMEPQSQSEIEALREQLHESEDVCRALRRGEVDAVVVGTADEKRILLMSGAYARYRQIVEDIEQGAVTVTEAGEILFANHAFAALTGRQLIDLFRTPLASYVSSQDRGKLAALLQPGLGALDTTVTLRGTASPVKVSIVCASDNFVTLLFTDMGQREQSEEALQTLEAIRKGAVDAFVVDGEQVVLLESAQTPYRVVVERMHEGAVLLDSEGSIAFANEQFLSMVGAPARAVRGKGLRSFLSPQDHRTLQTLLDTHQAGQADLRVNRWNGETLAMHVTLTRLDGQRLLLFRDTTLEKRHQASDERTHKFLGMLAHEFRNILAPISNSVQVLKKTPAIDDEALKSVEIIERQSERLMSLVEDLRRINPQE